MIFCESTGFIHLRNLRIVIPFPAMSYMIRRRGDRNIEQFSILYRITQPGQSFYWHLAGGSFPGKIEIFGLKKFIISIFNCYYQTIII